MAITAGLSLAKKWIAVARNAAKGFKKGGAVAGAPEKTESIYQKVVGNIYQAGWAYDALQRFGGDDWPAYTEGCVVRVVGNKLSKKADLKKLALSVAFGRAQPADTDFAVSHNIKIEIDEINKIVTVQFVWSMGGMLTSSVSGASEPSGLSATAVKGVGRMVTDRQDFIAGGDWTRVLKPIAVASASGFLPNTIGTLEQYVSGQPQPLGTETLPAYTQVLVTDKPAINPFPVFDGVSRSTDMTKLIAQVLESGCSQKYQPETAGSYSISNPPSSSLKVQTVPVLELQAFTPSQPSVRRQNVFDNIQSAVSGGITANNNAVIFALTRAAISGAFIAGPPTTGSYTPGVLSE